MLDDLPERGYGCVVEHLPSMQEGLILSAVSQKKYLLLLPLSCLIDTKW